MRQQHSPPAHPVDASADLAFDGIFTALAPSYYSCQGETDRGPHSSTRRRLGHARRFFADLPIPHSASEPRRVGSLAPSPRHGRYYSPVAGGRYPPCTLELALLVMNCCLQIGDYDIRRKHGSRLLLAKSNQILLAVSMSPPPK